MKYFGIQYLKAYKKAVVEDLRNKAQPEDASIDRPKFTLLLGPKALPQPKTRLSSQVWVGSERKLWVMGADYTVHESEMLPPAKGKGAPATSPKAGETSASPAASPTSESRSIDGGASSPTSVARTLDGNPLSPLGDSRFLSGSASGPGAGLDARTWLPDSATTVCMNDACGAKFGSNTKRHCRSCALIFCDKCRPKRANGEKTCDKCHASREAAPETRLPLLKRPKGGLPQIRNFSAYTVELSEADQFAAAGAPDAAAKAQAKDTKNKGAFKLVLKHRRVDTRPTLTIGFDTIEERDSWRALISTACTSSPEPVTSGRYRVHISNAGVDFRLLTSLFCSLLSPPCSDPILKKAFIAAYRKLRWHAWVWTSWYIDGTESELLTDILVAVIDREIVGPELAGKAGFIRNFILKGVRKAVHMAVDADWSVAQSGINKARGPIEEIAGSLLNPVFEKEVEIKGKLQAQVEEIAKKGLDKAESTLQEKFADKFPVVAAAVEAQLSMIHSSLATLLTELGGGEGTIAQFEYAYSWLQWRGDWVYGGKQGEITRLLESKLDGSEGNSVTKALCYHLKYDFKDLQQSLYHVLLEEVRTAAKDAGAIALSQVLPLVRASYPKLIERAAADLAMLCEWRLVLALDDTLRPPVMENSGKAIDAITSPLSALIPEALQDVIDPARTAEEVIQNVFTNTEKDLVARMLAPLQKSTIEQGQKLAGQGLQANPLLA